MAFLAVVYLVVLRCDVKVFWSQELYQLRPPGTLEELRLDSINTDKYCTTYRIELINCCMPYETERCLFIAAKDTFTLPDSTTYILLGIVSEQTPVAVAVSFHFVDTTSSQPFQFWQRGVP